MKQFLVCDSVMKVYVKIFHVHHSQAGDMAAPLTYICFLTYTYFILKETQLGRIKDHF